jgi:hypothetical protein
VTKVGQDPWRRVHQVSSGGSNQAVNVAVAQVSYYAGAKIGKGWLTRCTSHPPTGIPARCGVCWGAIWTRASMGPDPGVKVKGVFVVQL